MGHDYADLYRDQMTIRQLWIRLKVILTDATSPLAHAIARDRAAAEEQGQLDAMDDALANVSGPQRER